MTRNVDDERRLRLLVERTRLGLAIVVGSNLIFAMTDASLPDAERRIAWLIKVIALSTCAAGFHAIGKCRTPRAARWVIWLIVGASATTTGLSGIVTDDATTTLVLCVLIAWGSAVLLPVNAREQLPIAIMAAVASLATGFALRGHLSPSADYPVAALIVGVASSVYIAFLLDRFRIQVWKAEAALRVSQERWRRRVENAFDYISELELNGNIRYASANQIQMGYEPSTLIGRNALEFVHPEELEEVGRSLASVATTKSATVVTRFLQADGNYRWLEISGRVFVGEDDSPRLLTVGRDVTERRQLDLELRAANSALQESNRVKTYFSGTMAHELRNTFTAILGFIELVSENGGRMSHAEGAESEDQEESILRSLGRAAQDGLDIITITLELSRGELGEKERVRDVVSPGDIFREIDNEIPHSTRKAGVALVWKVDGELRLRTDPVKLKMVLKNLITNSMKFTSEGVVTVSAASAEGRVEISVSDSGAGIAPESLPQLFDPFTQAHGRKSRRMGAGLGLFIVRRLVEIMGGEIDVRSEVGKGSVFTVRLPSELNAEGEPPAEQERTAATAKRSLRVLVAEDNRVNQLFVEHLIARQGHSVHVVENGAEALAALQEKDFDVLLLDLIMPVMDGLSVARQLQQVSPRGRNPLVIAMTACEDQTALNDLRAAGVAAFVGKPVDPLKLREALAAAPG